MTEQRIGTGTTSPLGMTRWIDNIHRVMPKGEVVPVPILCSVTFGAPILLEAGEDRRAFLERARAAVVALRDV